jgi:hypothetical protein
MTFTVGLVPIGGLFLQAFHKLCVLLLASLQFITVGFDHLSMQLSAPDCQCCV